MNIDQKETNKQGWRKILLQEMQEDFYLVLFMFASHLYLFMF